MGVGMDGVDQVVDVSSGTRPLRERSSWSEPMSITPDAIVRIDTVTALFGRISVQWATGST